MTVTALGSLQTAPLDVEMEMQTNVDGVEVETVRGIYTEMEMNMEMQMNHGMIGIIYQMMEMKLKKWLHTNQIEEFSFPLILFTMQWLPIHFLKV